MTKTFLLLPYMTNIVIILSIIIDDLLHIMQHFKVCCSPYLRVIAHNGRMMDITSSIEEVSNVRIYYACYFAYTLG